MAKQPLSIVIITLNAAHQLSDCLDRCHFADEIVVVDSGSQDGTVALAQSKRARVIHQSWLGYGPQKQFAVNQAQHDWVLCLDADERLSDALQQAIIEVLHAPRHVAYQMPRCNRFLGRWLRHGEGYPDWSLRLFNRRYGHWSDDPVHEKVVIDQGAVGRLNGDLMHESEEGLVHYLVKQERYTSIQADQLVQQGKSVGIAKLLFSPLIRFIKFYFIRRGFLDGIPGLIHIAIGCWNSFIKYAKLYEKRRGFLGNKHG